MTKLHKYNYKIERIERKRFEGNIKIPECNSLVIHLMIKQDGQTVEHFKDTFFMLKCFEWRLSELFRSVGLKKRGKPCRMDLSKLPGATGQCELDRVGINYIDAANTLT